MSASLNRSTPPDRRPIERRLTVAEAAAIAGRHPVTIRKDLEAGILHGTQRVKGGRWIIRESCLDTYLDGTPCPHENRPATIVSLDARRARGGAR